MVVASRAGHRQLPERRHLPSAAPRVARPAGVPLPGVRVGHPLVRQHPGGRVGCCSAAAAGRAARRSPLRYPLVEGITGLAFLAAFLRIGPSPALLVAWAFIAVVMALAFINHDHAVIPNRLVVPGGRLRSRRLHRPRSPALVAVRRRLPGAGLVALLLSFVRARRHPLQRGQDGASPGRRPRALRPGGRSPWRCVLGIVRRNLSTFSPKIPIKSKDGLVPYWRPVQCWQCFGQCVRLYASVEPTGGRHVQSHETHGNVDAEVMTWL